ncbi:MAG: ATP-binding cassette domain-containing protein, partial [Verrucomicrobiota bacterium]
MSDVEPHMRASSLTLRYGDKIAYQDVSMDIAQGEITALVGPSGCGKSSFLQSLNRLTDMIPNCVVTGEISLDGKSICNGDTDVVSLRRRVGLIFQKPNPFPYSIRRNLEFPLKEHGVKDRDERHEIIERRLIEVGLWDE